MREHCDVELPQPDVSLRFGLWPGRPVWLIAPIVDQLADRRLSDVPTRDAASIIEGVALFQWIRTGIVAVPVLAVAAVLDRLGLAGMSASIMWTLALASVLVLPWYMLLLGLVQLRLKRSPHPDERVGLVHSRLIASLSTAPRIAGVLALVCGVFLH